MNRRRFLAGTTAAALTGCRRGGTPAITGKIVGAKLDLGHLLRSGGIPPISGEERVSAVIVGAGVAGLSAGWRLEQRGLSDFRILDLDDKVGGNSQWDANAVSAYPWGAHYVPMPTEESVWVRELFEELGVIEGRGPDGKPVYNERFICGAPQERLFMHGRWQDGLIPGMSTARDQDEFERFNDIIADYKERRDSRGRKRFAIPMELSSTDPNFINLDRISMAHFLTMNQFESERLHWYVDYACRDDFGTHHADVSAWAGMHYFASRDASEDEHVLTWPQGNGWIVERLERKLRPHIAVSSLVYRIEQTRESATVDVYHPAEKRSERLVADQVIFACPTFMAKRIVADIDDRMESLAHFEYAPWLVANLTLSEIPPTKTGAPLAWDNVIYDSASLGYVVATHQSLARHQEQTVLTYYRALTSAGDRERLMTMDWNTAVEQILTDLQRPHPEIREIVRNIDVMKWGHGMIRPKPGFIWGPHRRQMAKPLGRIHFANSDLSGFSIFEEAQFRGVTAADQVIQRLEK
jgi:monoamine oxidase